MKCNNIKRLLCHGLAEASLETTHVSLNSATTSVRTLTHLAQLTDSIFLNFNHKRLIRQHGSFMRHRSGPRDRGGYYWNGRHGENVRPRYRGGRMAVCRELQITVECQSDANSVNACDRPDKYEALKAEFSGMELDCEKMCRRRTAWLMLQRD